MTSPSMVDSVVLIAAIAAAIFWNLLTWKVGLPSSSSHALIGGICGAVIISYGAINGDGILTIVSGLVLSPVVAMFCGYIIMTLFYIILRNFSKGQVNNVAKRIQVLSAALMAFSHGSNDAQKSMGIITLALLSGGFIGALEVPVYVKVACALAMSAGTSVGDGTSSAPWEIKFSVCSRSMVLQPI